MIFTQTAKKNIKKWTKNPWSEKNIERTTTTNNNDNNKFNINQYNYDVTEHFINYSLL